MLNISDKKLENATVELTIDVPVERVESEYQSAFKKIRNSVTVDGFRKGKAPLPMIEARFGREADREVAESLLKSVSFEAIREKQLTPITFPHYSFERISRNEPFSFKATFEVPPAVELGPYRDLTAEEQQCAINDDDVAMEIQTIRERFAKMNPKGEGAAVENGDMTKIKVRRIDDVPEHERDAVEFKEYQIVVGKSRDESALDKFITGMKVGEMKKVEVKYPRDYYLGDLAGQKVTYEVIIEDLNSVELPELNEEFVANLGYGSVEEFKAKTREYLERYVSEKARGDAKAQILRAIVEGSVYDIPESMILNQMNDLFKRTRESVGYYADNMEEFAALMGMDIESFRERMRGEATNTLKTTLALSEIAKKESLKVDEGRYREVVENIAKKNRKTVEEIEKIITENDSRENIENELLLDGAMEFIYENARIKKLKPVSLQEFMKSQERS